MSRWSDQQTSRFMRIYRDNEHLWNVRHPHYRSRALRRDSLRKFVQALRIPDFTVGDVVKKIKSLRSTYYLEMKKIANSGVDAGGAPLYTPSMNWFREMDDIMKLVKELEVSTKSVNNREFSPPIMLFPINNALIGTIYQSLIVTSIYSCCFSFVVIEIRTQEPVARYSVTN